MPKAEDYVNAFQRGCRLTKDQREELLRLFQVALKEKPHAEV
jgi:hypothetical protein